MNLFVRLFRSLPLVVFLAVLAVVVYFAVSWRRSPNRAKEVLIKLFLALTGALTAFFGLASLYALLDGNASVLELTGAFAAVSVVALGITLVCRWRFLKNHPNYRYKATRTRYDD